MTTIAYRDGVIAADTFGLVDGCVYPGRMKIACRGDGALIGASGNAGFCDAFRKWACANDGSDPPKVPADTGGFVVLTNGIIQILDCDEGAYTISPNYFAYGSGSPIALGAMHHGATAEEAVRAAIEHDRSSNGDVAVLKSSRAIDNVGSG